MKKAKRDINRFINYLFATYDVPRIPVHVMYGYETIATPNGYGFGLYTEDADGSNARIYVGYGKLGKSTTMHCIAHEFVHYMQSLHGREMNNSEENEVDAEYWANALLNQFLINRKSKKMHIDGVAEIWESKTGDTL